MALRDIKTGEMIDITRDWLTEEKMPIFTDYELTAAYPKLLKKHFDLLTSAVEHPSPSLSDEEREQISELVAVLDDDFDDQARVIHKACELFAQAFPDQREAYQKASRVILPDGLALINTSYRNEAGETERIVERVNADSQVRQTLENTTLSGVKLSDWYDRLVDTGRRIGPLATRLGVTGDHADEVVLEFKARQRWTNIVTTLRRSAYLARWTDEHLEAIFAQVDRISAQRAKPSPEAPASPTEPEPNPPPPATDPQEPS